MAAILEARGVTKRFGAVVANRHVNFLVQAGTVHALVGENGAGKTTLMNILYGLYQPDEGQILLDGRPVRFSGAAQAIGHGLGMIHQHFMLIPTLTVAENITMGREPRSLGLLVDRSAARSQVTELAQRYGLGVDPDAVAGRLPVSLQQRVEILKALYQGARILILDEPTALLTPQETEELLRIIRQLRDDGRTIVFISHKLGEVMAVADEITVLRHGETVTTLPAPETEAEQLAELMVGQRVTFERYRHVREPGEPVLEAEGLTVADERGHVAVRDLSFSVRAGEVLGLAGVAGNGQSELILAMTGYLPAQSGRIRLLGQDVTRSSIRRRREMGLGLIPEDRNGEGLVGNFSNSENLWLGYHRRPPAADRGVLHNDLMKHGAVDLMQRFDVRPRNPETLARLLSGGNQQKLIVARECSREPRLLIAVQPTRGLDIGAVKFVHKQIIAQRDRGAAVLLMSLDLEEVTLLASRILVMYRGQVADLAENGARSQLELGLFMMKGKAEGVEAHA